MGCSMNEVEEGTRAGKEAQSTLLAINSVSQVYLAQSKTSSQAVSPKRVNYLTRIPVRMDLIIGITHITL